MLNKETIKEIALANGFKLKEQADGEMDLNPYVYDTINKAIAFYESQKNGGWVSIDDDLPTIESKEDYLVYSTSTKVYEKVDAKKLRIMIDNSAKITHWQPMPQLPKE